MTLRARRESVLQFLSDPSVPITNNQAEQDVRMTKLRIQTSGEFRSGQGAKDFTTLRSALSTTGKLGLSRIEALLGGPAALLAAVHSKAKPSLC